MSRLALRGICRRLADRAAGPAIAAAVCFRDCNGQLQLLLVRTSDGQRWTFPKGRRDGGETLAQAAAREAGEEAGVRGLIAGDGVLTHYRHSPSRIAGRTDDPVAAFVLAVNDLGPSTETGRDPTWFDLGSARERLAEGRDADHASELRRVVTVAERALRAR